MSSPGAHLDCPYCTSWGECKLRNPYNKCDDYYAYVGDEEEDETEDDW